MADRIEFTPRLHLGHLVENLSPGTFYTSTRWRPYPHGCWMIVPECQCRQAQYRYIQNVISMHEIFETALRTYGVEWDPEIKF